MGKWVTDYGKGGYIATGQTYIDDDGRQIHYDVSGFLVTGRSEPNAYGGLDHMNVSGTFCHGHTERYGNDDVHTDVSGVFAEGRTEHYGDRSVHTDVDGFLATGLSRPGGSVGLHGPKGSQGGSQKKEVGPPGPGGCDSDSHSGNSGYGDSAYSGGSSCYSGGGALAGLYHLRSDSNRNLAILAIVAVATIGLGAFAIRRMVINPFLDWVESDNPPAAVQPSPRRAYTPERRGISPQERPREPAREMETRAPLAQPKSEPRIQPSQAPPPQHAGQDGHRGPRIVKDIGERHSAQPTHSRTAPEAETSGRRRHPEDYDVVGFECSKVNNSRLRCDAYLRDGRSRAVTCDRVGTGRIHSCGPFGPGHDRQEFDVRWILRSRPARPQYEPPPRPPRYVRRY
ncbi:MAG: hypothetical protein PHY95_02980 [Candidatus ainarchaeum sp.]|nr:hypothetical protein [Candidatus ainarchaeum sp.]